MKLLIRNLARTTTEDELKEMFEAYGSVQSCSLVVDKKTGGSKGFGFIEMPKPGEAKAAMKNINGTELDGKIIRVKRAAATPVKATPAGPYEKSGSSSQDPLHGVTLEMMVTRLVEKYGWEELGHRIKIKCFTSEPSIASSLTFLRKTPWAREKVEALYLRSK